MTPTADQQLIQETTEECRTTSKESCWIMFYLGNNSRVCQSSVRYYWNYDFGYTNKIWFDLIWFDDKHDGQGKWDCPGGKES